MLYLKIIIIIYFLYFLENKLKVLTKKYLYGNNRYNITL